MPIEHTVTLTITCGNSTCPGHGLDPADRTGWLFVIVEEYGQPVTPQRVFCSFNCLAVFVTKVARGNEEWAPVVPEINPEMPLPLP